MLLLCFSSSLVAYLRDQFSLGGSRYSCRAPTLMLDAHMSTYIKVHIGTLTAHAMLAWNEYYLALLRFLWDSQYVEKRVTAAKEYEVVVLQPILKKTFCKEKIKKRNIFL